jgi:poly(A) polymerase
MVLGTAQLISNQGQLRPAKDSDRLNLESRTDITPALRIIPRDQHIISRKNISKAALRVLYRLNEVGYTAYLVGGAVRDLLLGLHPKDFDIATSATPDEVKKLFRNCRLIGRRFRLAHVVFGPEIIEVATFRGLGEEGAEGDRHIIDGRIVRDNIWGTIEEDAVRRDFRVNALYYDISDFSVRDYVGGMQDLQDRVLRLIGDPVTRYREDPVRMLRAARLAAKLDMRIDTAAMAPFETLGPLLADAAPARLFDESLKMFLGGHGLKSFRMLEHCGLLKFLFPATARALKRGDNALRSLVEQGLANTDTRIAEGKSVTPAFLFAVLLWGEVRDVAHRWHRGMGARRGPGGCRAVPAGGHSAPFHLHHGRNLVAAATLRASSAQARVPSDDPSALSRSVRFSAAARR